MIVDAQETWLQELFELLGADAVEQDSHALAAFEEGWRYGRGKARAVVRPSTPEEVAKVLHICQQHGIRVQPVGANTGLVGATNPDTSGEQLVLSLERLNKTIDVDPIDGSVLVDGGVLLSQLNAALEPYDAFFPIDLGADPQVGGMVATNTGGTRLLRYGDVRQNLLGVEVALADGTLVSELHRLRKNNTGLDFKQLFVGTSGTFGIVTRAVLRVVPKPQQRTAVMACAESGTAVLKLLERLERSVGEFLSAFEVISRAALEVTLRRGSIDRNPFAGGVPGQAVLVELSSRLPRETLDLEALLESTLADHFEAEVEAEEALTDVLVGQAEDFWNIRHQVSESLRAEGHVLAFDLSVPRSRLAEFTETVVDRLAQSHPGVRVCDFGHWGDGGTHLNLVWERGRGEDAGLRKELQELVYELCVRGFGGSFSAEHGVGPHNQRFYEAFTGPRVREVCQQLKRTLDPERRLGTVELG